MKKFLALTLALLMALSLVACGRQPAADDNQDADSTPVDTSNYVKTDYNPTKPMTKGINGEDPASLADFSFTDEELQQLKDGNFKVAIAYHQLGDQCNVVKCEAAKATFEELGIEVLTVTEAQMNDNTQYDQLETIAAMNPDATSYEDLFEVCRKLNIPANEQSELYRRTVFNIMGGNVDDHIKNFSFLMEKNGTWHITPAYDMTFTTNLDGAAYENIHSMSISGKNDGITEDDLLLFAKLNGIKNAKKIIEEVSLAISHFYNYATNYQIDDYWKDRIESHLSGLVLPNIGETMKHYLPTIVEPYEAEHGFLVTKIDITENTRHDFRIEAVINGKRQKYIAGRKSDLAAEIITKGRNKMAAENKKELVQRLLLPLAKREFTPKDS